MSKPPERAPRLRARTGKRSRDWRRVLVSRTVLPGEWFLVRFGGTRKGTGTFYTKPQLAVPTVHRTLRPLAYDPPAGPGGKPNEDAPAAEWTPKKPEEILALKVCDPACGSGSFLVASLRFLTELSRRASSSTNASRPTGRRLSSRSPKGLPGSALSDDRSSAIGVFGKR